MLLTIYNIMALSSSTTYFDDAMAPLADATIVVAGGQRLPVHTAYLAGASPVMLGLFVSQAGDDDDDDAALQPPPKKKV